MNDTNTFINRDNTYYAVGVINFDTAETWHNASQSLFATHANKVLTVNLSDLSPMTNSAVLALIIEWLKLAAAHRVTFKLAGMPETLQSIANISGVLELLDDCLVH